MTKHYSSSGKHDSYYGRNYNVILQGKSK